MRGIQRWFLVRMFAVACCAMLLVTLPHNAKGDSKGADEPISAANLPSKDLLKSVPADYFIENAGQLSNHDVRFYTTSGDLQIGFAESAVLIKMVERAPATVIKSPTDRELIRSSPPEPVSSRGVLLRLSFEGANRVVPQGSNPLPHQTNFFIGNDPTRWRTGVRSYGEIVYEELYDEIDLVYRVGPNGLKYDFLVQPGADPARIRMVYEGIESLDVNPDRLVLRTAAGEVRDNELMAAAGGESVRCEFRREGIRAVGFACKGWERVHTLVIDPLLWATYLGGSNTDEAYAIALDASGNAVVAGYTDSADFPATPGAYDVTHNSLEDVSVAKVSADGSSLLWATYLGGGDSEHAWALALDGSGNPVVAGETRSMDFPATPGAYDVTFNGSVDAFVAKLSADGSSLLWATYLGGSDQDAAYALALDGSGNPVVAGYTWSADYPATPGAYDVTYNDGLYDAFVAKLGTDGSSLLWATYLGGSDGWDLAIAITLDSSGNPVVTGTSESMDFPTTPGSYDQTYGGGDAFVAKLSADGSSLLWATYLGGSNWDTTDALALDASDNVVVIGLTQSVDIPVTPGAYDVSFNGLIYDAFIAKLSADGSSLLWATYLGGSDKDIPWGFALDASGNAIVAGETWSADFPVTPDAFDDTLNGEGDVFLARLSADGSSLLYATYLGGAAWDVAYALALDSSDDAVIAGHTYSLDFPTTPGAYDVAFNGIWDGFVAKLSLAKAPFITITSPVGSEVWIQGSSQTVSWMASDIEDPRFALLVWINYTSSAGSGSICGPVAGDFGHCDWTLPSITATDVVVVGTVVDTDDLKGYDQSGQFTIQAPPPPNTPPAVTIGSPSGGEVWMQGSTHSVMWIASDNEDTPSTLVVWINYTSGTGDGNICGPVAGDAGSCAWTLPIIADADVVVNGTVIDTGGLKGYNDSGPFTIEAPPNTPPTMTVTSPSGGEVWTQGSYHTVTWMASDNEDAPPALLVWVNYTSIAGSGSICGPVAGDIGYCDWTLPMITATDVVVNGTVIDTGGLRGYDESGPFTIQAPPNTPPMITITSPSGGEVWTSGTSQTIAWTASDNEDAPSILLVWINYTSSAGSGSICGPVPGGFGTRSWVIPIMTATMIVFNGTVVDTGGLRGYDESEVTIQAPPPSNTSPTVTITSPTGGEEFLKGSSHDITWTMHDDEDVNANLTVYINCTTGGVTSQVVAALKGQLSFTWTLPNIEADDVVVNITVIDSGGLKGWSQSGPFTIKAPSSPTPDFLSQYWWLVVVIVAVVVVLLLLALMRRRKPKEEEEEVPPSEGHGQPPRE